MKVSRVVRDVALVAAAGSCLAVGTSRASSVLALSVEDQARLANLVVAGEVVQVRGVENPTQGIESAVTLRVTTVLKGDVRTGKTLVFHTRSGEVNGVVSSAVGEAVLARGQKVLAFIEDVDGRLYNLGLSMGVWNVVRDATGVSYVRALQDGLEVVGPTPVERGPIAAADMATRVAHAIANPTFDEPMLRSTRLTGGTP
jgi:hypothetical protein